MKLFIVVYQRLNDDLVQPHSTQDDHLITAPQNHHLHKSVARRDGVDKNLDLERPTQSAGNMTSSNLLTANLEVNVQNRT
jgi:hypothetical protein